MDPFISVKIWIVVPRSIAIVLLLVRNNNPYFDRYERIHSMNRDIFNGSLFMEYRVIPQFKLSVRSGFDMYNDNQIARISKGSYHGAGSATVIRHGKQIWGEANIGSYNVGLGRGYSINNDLILNANKKFGYLNIEGMLGGTIFYIHDEGIQAFTQGGLSIPGFYSLKASVLPLLVLSNTKKQQVNSIFGRLMLSWHDYLFLEGTLRNDWSSTFYSTSTEQSTKNYGYPSLSASFVISELINDVNWLSLWKLRASWASAKTPPTAYTINQAYEIENSVWNNLSSARLLSSIRGTNVLPESSETYELGSILNLFRNSVSVDFTYYSKRMYNFLKAAEISRMSGYKTNYVNIDEEITRRGIELTLKAVPLRLPDWNWNVLLNYSRYAKYYTQLDPVYSLDKPWVKVGKRADYYTVKKYQRDSEGNLVHLAGLPLREPYRSLFGYRDPDWIWGFSSSLRYKNMEVNVSFDGRVGGLAKTITEMYMWYSGNHPESIIPERYLDATRDGGHFIGNGVKVVSGNVTYDSDGNITNDTREFVPNDVPVTYDQYIKKLHSNNAWNEELSSMDLYSTTFIKIRELSLTYLLPYNICERIASEKASVSFVGQNLFLWAKDFKYSDPDGGRENFSDPSVRYLGVNLKVTF